jgi:hypothetical protein
MRPPRRHEKTARLTHWRFLLACGPFKLSVSTRAIGDFMTKKAHAPATPSVNAGMKMSPEGRARMRRRERDVYNYYDDMGPGKGNCTWGAGILAHKEPCTKDELAKPVSEAAVEAEFSRRVAAAEAGVIRNVRHQKLPQDHSTRW